MTRLRQYWWVACLAAGAVLVGLHLAGRMYLGSLAVTGLVGALPIADWILIAVLWSGAGSDFFWAVAASGLALGGVGWGLRRMVGPVGMVTGASIALATGLSPLAAESTLALAPATPSTAFYRMLQPGPGWAPVTIALGLAAAGWTWAKYGRAQGLNLAAAALASMVASGACLMGLATRMNAVSLDVPQPALLAAIALAGTFPALTIVGCEPRRRRRWRTLALGAGLPLAVLAATIPRMVPLADVVEAHDYMPADLPEWEGWEGNWRASASFLGDERRTVSVDRTPRADGYATRLVLPDPRLSFGVSSPFPSFMSMKRDLNHLPEARETLRQMLEGRQATIIAGLVYLNLSQADPMLPPADLNFIAGLGERFPYWPTVAAKAAGALVLRGEQERAQELLDAAVPVLERENRLRTLAGACPEGGCSMPRYLREATEMTAWPAMRGPKRGKVTIRFGLSRVSGIEGDLYAGLVALHHPDRPTEPGAPETVGDWEPAGVAMLHRVVDGEVVLEGLPQGRYALQVGFREGEHEGLGLLALSGVPTEPIEVGPNNWEREVLLPVWPEDPLEAWCEDGWLEFPPLPLAAGYRVEGWSLDGGVAQSGTASWGGVMRLEFTREASGPHLRLSDLVGDAEWPSGGFRVVAVDDFGRESARFHPVGSGAQAYAWDEEACHEAGLADRFGESQ